MTTKKRKAIGYVFYDTSVPFAERFLDTEV